MILTIELSSFNGTGIFLKGYWLKVLSWKKRQKKQKVFFFD